MAEQQQVAQKSLGTDESQTFSNLLDQLHDITQVINTGRQQKKAIQRQALHHYCESDDDISSEGSEGEDEIGQQRQDDSVEDIQAEMSRLEISEEASTLETLILIVEHYIKTGDLDGFSKNMRRPDLWLMTSPRPKVVDIIAMAENLSKQDLPFRAVLMYKCSCTLYKYEYLHHLSNDVTSDDITPDEAIRGIEESMQKVYSIFHSVVSKDEFEIYLPHFIPVMYDMLTNLREIHNSDRKLKANLEAWCMLYITMVHGKRNQIQEMHDVAETTTGTLERRFKKKVEKLQVYGANLIASSLANYQLHNSAKAEDLANAAEQSLQDADDISDWDTKVKLVEKARKLFECIRKKI